MRQMAGIRRLAWVVAPCLAIGPSTAGAAGECHVVDLDFTPAESPNQTGMQFPLQMVAWIEDLQGNYVETIFITQQTGTFGLGNRPGRFDFNSGPRWPYGRRLTVLPVWAHRHGITFPDVVFQNGVDDNLSHPFNQSSRENHFCRPLQRSEVGWDTATCASAVYTDKGTLGAGTSVYPPRQDVARNPQTDSLSVDMYNMLNPFDAVSTATPASGVHATVSWPIPQTMPAGDYVLFVEVAREFDMNATYNKTVYPPPAVEWSAYGLPYRGQPSVVYRVPFTMGPAESIATASDYVGYGDPDGIDGNLRTPDGTITTTVPGSGAARLALTTDGTAMFRVRVTSRNEDDAIAPSAPGGLQVTERAPTTATLRFLASGDDGTTGRARSYEVRMRVGEPITAESFDASPPLTASISIQDGGTATELVLDGLLPETTYSVGMRAVDNCANASAITVVTFTTEPRALGEVDACFVATAAYGSLMANDVDMLRRFRDLFLQHSVVGELAVEGYYTVGPAVAQVVGQSDLLRATARRFLGPMVEAVRRVKL
jgi:hypothetical protein